MHRGVYDYGLVVVDILVSTRSRETRLLLGTESSIL